MLLIALKPPLDTGRSRMCDGEQVYQSLPSLTEETSR